MAHQEKRADFCFEKALALAPRDWFVRWLAGESTITTKNLRPL
jgi:hypothetical protein